MSAVMKRDGSQKNGMKKTSQRKSVLWTTTVITICKVFFVLLIGAWGARLYGPIITVIAVFIIGMELISAFILIRKIHLPMQRVMDHASSLLLEGTDCHNEYELIDVAFSRLETYARKMKTTQYRYRRNIRKEILQELLYGGGNHIGKEELEEAGIRWGSDTVLCVVSISINHLEAVKEIYSYSDMSLFCFAMINIMEEYLGNAGYTAYGVDNEDFSVSFVMQLEEPYEDGGDYALETFHLENATAIQRLLYGAKQELERILNSFTVFIGVGRSVRGYEEIHRSWLDTQYATVYRFTRGDQVVTLFMPHMESYESGIQYPWEMEKKLLLHMKSGREEAILATVEEMFAAVEKMAPDEMRWALNQMMTSIFRSGMANAYKMKDGSPLDWKDWVDELNATDTKYEMKDVLIRLVMNLSMETEDDASTKRRLADSIKEYVDVHFCEDTVSASEIARRMGYSLNYVRQAYKEVYGKSVSDYVMEKRIARAQELLTTTNYTSKKIAQMVGYSDNRYFYVLFKKKTGETAENYRKKNQ